MQHIKVTFATNGEEQNAMLIALLADGGYEGFEEENQQLLAYIREAQFDREQLAEIASAIDVKFEIESVAAQNWNAIWESNFSPVIVDNFCTIRADFHELEVKTPYEIVITPKMSFGTGHHATTQLMMQLMRDTSLAGARVLDFGSGTGVLAILAEMLGASEVLAIDNDDWCVENASENVVRNRCRHVTIKKGSLEDAGTEEYDVILANINRHILLEYMEMLHARLKRGGMILMSGLLTENEETIKTAAAKTGLQFARMKEQMNWIAMTFNKL